MLTRMRQWLRAAFRREHLEREMVHEMRTHLDLSTEKFVARGLPSLEARWAAKREFGNVALLEEQSWDARGAVWVESLRSDLRFAIRALVAKPGFAAVAILSLAIGIGANTAIFSLIDAVILKSLPVQRPQDLALVVLRDSTQTSALGNTVATNPMWEAMRAQTKGLATYAVS